MARTVPWVPCGDLEEALTFGVAAAAPRSRHAGQP